MKNSILIIITILFFNNTAVSQNHTMPKTLSIYLDCSNSGICYLEYLKQELSFLNFVRDRMDADVHILLTSQYKSGGGQSLTAYMIGRNQYVSKTDTSIFFIDANLTDDEKRKALFDNLQKGLMPFILKTELAKKVKFEIEKTPITLTDTIIKDPWNFWVFQLGFNGNINSSQNYSNSSIRGYINISREVEKSSTNLYVNSSLENQKYVDQSQTYTYKIKSYNSDFNHTKKLNEHLGIGFYQSFVNSLYSNYKIKLSGKAAIEYSLFPYKEYNTRRIVFGLEVGPYYQKYYDTTIYFKTKELLWQQNLSAICSFTMPWGSVNTGFYWSNYLHDFAKNQFSISGALSTKIVKGLNFSLWGNYAFVHDQLNIRKGDATLGQLLLRNRELLSTYDFSLGAGISYRFGSKNNNQIFPAFKGLSYSINY